MLYLSQTIGLRRDTFPVSTRTPNGGLVKEEIHANGGVSLAMKIEWRKVSPFVVFHIVMCLCV